MLKISPKASGNNPEELGIALRKRRKALGLTMQFVADEARLSVGFISQVERGLTSPSLASLASLAAVLETSISEFLEQPSSKMTTRRSSRESYSVGSGTISYERISTRFKNSKLHSVITHELPGYQSEPASHVGEELFYVISGELTVEIEDELHLLREGDTIHFDSRRLHALANHSNEITTMLWCGTMDIFGDAPSPLHKDTAGNGAATLQSSTKENPDENKR